MDKNTSLNCKPIKIEPPTYEIRDPNDEVYILNEYELLELRVQIKRKSEEGWYVIFDNQVIPIDIDGKISEWPPGLCDHIEKYLYQLIQ